MPTILTHAVVGATIARSSSATSKRPWMIAAAFCATLPDIDVVTFHFGIPYGSMLGHRGLTHSILFAAIAGTVTARAAFVTSAWAIGVVFFLATLSHGLLDALTNGGLGVAFF